MKKDIYGYLDKYSIYNPEYIPPDFSFSFAPISLQKNEKFQFLTQQLAEYHKSPKSFNKISTLSFASAQWKSCFFKNLHGLLTEVVYTTDAKIQEEMLGKLQLWFFAKIRMPNIAASSSGLSESPLRQSPNFLNANQKVSKHTKSFSVDHKEKKGKNYIEKVYREVRGFETLQLGTAGARVKILQRVAGESERNFVRSPSPVSELYKAKMQMKLPSIGGELTRKVYFGEENLCERSCTPIDTILKKTTENVKNVKKFPNGGELLMKLPIKSATIQRGRNN